MIFDIIIFKHNNYMENEKNMKESIFLGEHGVTSTSANYVANVAKEMIRSEQEALDGLNFVSTTVTDDIGMTAGGLIAKQGDQLEALMQVPAKLERVAKMKMLIGWLREGIKAKEEMSDKVSQMREREVGHILHLQQPCNLTESQWKSDCWHEESGYKFFLTKDRPAEADSLKLLPEADQCRVQLLQSRAAAMGKFIHEKGAFGMARKQAIECERNPLQIEKGGLGKATLFYTSQLAVSKAKIDEVYFAMQNAYREVQQELNALLFKAKDLWDKECHRIEEENKTILQEYDIANRNYNEAIWQWKRERRAEISDYKIIIPYELREIFDEVNRMGK